MSNHRNPRRTGQKKRSENSTHGGHCGAKRDLALGRRRWKRIRARTERRQGDQVIANDGVPRAKLAGHPKPVPEQEIRKRPLAYYKGDAEPCRGLRWVPGPKRKLSRMWGRIGKPRYNYFPDSRTTVLRWYCHACGSGNDLVSDGYGFTAACEHCGAGNKVRPRGTL